MDKAYDPAKFEDLIYAAWEKSGFFDPDNLPGSRKESFSIVMPPPNVTGTLHVGHAVMLALQDLMIRFERMAGKRALWIPGTDHAAIATQAKVEKILAQKGQSRQSLGREKFLKEVLKFVEESKSTIRRQIRKMGSSCDWSREAYTLDDARTKAVRTVFKMMYDDGLIYRGDRIVNWCPRCSSTLADDEVEYKPAKEKLYWIKYGPFILATARPETKLGDTAVAVHPKDRRYKKYVGKHYKIPGVLGEYEVVVVGDAAVDMKFGSGVIKVTPAHDFTDFEIAERHNLPMKQVIGEDGRMMPNTGKYAGMTTSEARAEIVKDMSMLGLIEKIEDYEHSLAICYRCGSIIEPLPKLQWFINVNKEFTFRQSAAHPIRGLRDGAKLTLKEIAQHVVKNGEIKILPERFVKTYFHWIDNLRDWNISRQIWFGHQVPVWYKQKRTNHPGLLINTDELYVGVKPPNGESWRQDTDTLDTWFSSGLWTFSTLGWPDKNSKDLRIYHPTSVLETGYDILFFWIARMILMTTYALGEVPFRTVYLHGLLRDEEGKKMSKSLGNIIDPLDVSVKYGTDAVRLSLILGSAPGGDTRIWDEKIAGFRNFTNKLWNISRFILTNVDVKKLNPKPYTLNPKTLADKWILSRLSSVAASITKKLEKFEFSSAGEELRDFTWGELADWYLEISKIQLSTLNSQLSNNTKEILLYLLQNILKLWHPFMPFVTEAVWQDVFSNPPAGGQNQFLMVEEWPTELTKEDKAAVANFGVLKEVVSAIRNIRAEQGVDPKNKINVFIHAGKDISIFKENEAMIKHLARIEVLNLKPKGPKFKGAISALGGKYKIDVFMSDSDSLVHEKKLVKELKEAEMYLKNLELKLKNKDFTSRAPKSVVDEVKNKHEEIKQRIVIIKDNLK